MFQRPIAVGAGGAVTLPSPEPDVQGEDTEGAFDLTRTSPAAPPDSAASPAALTASAVLLSCGQRGAPPGSRIGAAGNTRSASTLYTVDRETPGRPATCVTVRAEQSPAPPVVMARCPARRRGGMEIVSPPRSRRQAANVCVYVPKMDQDPRGPIKCLFVL